ncbi:Nudix family hydrolase [Chitinilyticum piscinae]|uniref:8-oxo-dGTP diphosphatase n=1 Tax=Chitinilyticum piscinae TaxID=2866724 RepID=A0A8J7KGJ3_9NEIS|nr:Nudix family hydrolase [Chitinilyticum piscinae]MBE9610434.1 Nudix family hydrolase [Chitinilyticum piscinae]
MSHTAHAKLTRVAAGILLDGQGQFMLASRPAGKVYAGYWEFPGGKLEEGETPLAALERELHEEMGITVSMATPWLVQRFVYPHAHVELHFFRVTAWQGEPHPKEGQQFAWQRPGALSVSPILPANGPLLRGLALPQQLVLSNASELGCAFLPALKRRLDDGLRWLILREPQLPVAEFAALAKQVQALTRPAGCKLLVHGDVALAREIGADGVHLSSRQLLALDHRPSGLDWVGASTHNTAELAAAESLGLDYVLLGHVCETASHPGAPPLGWDGFAACLTSGWSVPVYALGGMHPGLLATALQHGAQGIATLRDGWALA